MTIFLDINVILDVLLKRDPWFEHSADVLARLRTREDIRGVVAAHSVTTLYYLTHKHLDREQAVSALFDLLSFVSVASLDQEMLLKALTLDWEDIEDAVQGISARRVQADYLVSRNTDDFPSSFPIPVVTPNEFIATIETTR